MGVVSIVAADSRGKAIARTLKSAIDAHWHSVRFRDVKAVRAKEHDLWAEVDESKACWDEALLPTPPTVEAK